MYSFIFLIQRPITDSRFSSGWYSERARMLSSRAL